MPRRARPAGKSGRFSPGLWSAALRRMLKRPLVIICLVLLAAIAAACVAVPLLSPYHFNQHDLKGARQAPGAAHPLGTDEGGRDILTRLFYGGRITLFVALAATVLEILIGTAAGLAAGYFRRGADTVLTGVSEVILSLPSLIIAIAIMALLGSPSQQTMPILHGLAGRMGGLWRLFLLVLTLAGLGWPGVARMVRARTLSVREYGDVEACRALGLTSRAILSRHVLPEVLPEVLVYAAQGMASMMLAETAMSFLGLGVDAVTPTWGSLIESARSLVNLQNRWWIWLPAGVLLFLTVLCFHVAGDGLRRALDPDGGRRDGQ